MGECMTALNFIQWLKTLSDRRDPVRQLAYDMKDDTKARRFKTYSRFKKYLENEVNACAGAKDALERAWQEYDQQR